MLGYVISLCCSKIASQICFRVRPTSFICVVRRLHRTFVFVLRHLFVLLRFNSLYNYNSERLWPSLYSSLPLLCRLLYRLFHQSTECRSMSTFRLIVHISVINHMYSPTLIAHNLLCPSYDSIESERYFIFQVLQTPSPVFSNGLVQSQRSTMMQDLGGLHCSTIDGVAAYNNERGLLILRHWLNVHANSLVSA